ncbi:BatD family protein [Roseivirga sp.]|uniref:BatD family protein n=1 Tax=Roseivirga sp. TaxID=1964215 RepID=UPI003B8E7B15
MRKSSHILSVLLIALLFIPSLNAQELSVQLGKDEVGLNELFTITVTLQNGSIKSYSDFPDIEGFAKRGVSSSSKTNIVNGQISSSQSVIQRYLPLEEGSYTLNDFTVEVNGKKVSSKGKTIKIGPPVERNRNSRRGRNDPFGNLFGNDTRSSRTPEFVDVKEDAFLALVTDKDEVYVGEGFTATFAFYVADANRAPLQFYEAGKQLSKILKDLKPDNCWEENFNIENIYGEKVRINGKNYTRYKIYQAAFFPLNLEPVVFPSVPFEMIKYRVAKSPSFFGRDREEDFKTFNTSEKVVKVKALPPHPLKDAVAVGEFELDEKVDKNTVATGESFEYNFNIYGEGNISSIPDLKIPSTKDIDIYPPNTSQDVNKGGGRVTGSKKYSYYGIPNEPGAYDLKDYFSWIYFNPKSGVYDTLRSQVQLNVTGESKKNVSISSTDLGSFYDNIDMAANKLQKLKEDNAAQIIANILIIAMLAAAGFMFFKK